MPHAPAQRHFFFLLLQSSSEEHFRKHFCLRSVACSSSRGHSVDGEFRGFLYTLPSSSASDESSSSSQSSSSSSSGASVIFVTENPSSWWNIGCIWWNKKTRRIFPSRMRETHPCEPIWLREESSKWGFSLLKKFAQSLWKLTQYIPRYFNIAISKVFRCHFHTKGAFGGNHEKEPQRRDNTTFARPMSLDD